MSDPPDAPQSPPGRGDIDGVAGVEERAAPTTAGSGAADPQMAPASLAAAVGPPGGSSSGSGSQGEYAPGAARPGIGPLSADGAAAALALPRPGPGLRPNTRMPTDPVSNLRICYDYVRGSCPRPPGSCRYSHAIPPPPPPEVMASMGPFGSGVGAAAGAGMPEPSPLLQHHLRELSR